MSTGAKFPVAPVESAPMPQGQVVDVGLAVLFCAFKTLLSLRKLSFFYSFPNNDLYIFIFIVGKCISKTVRESVCNLGQLSLASLRGRLIEYQLRLG